MDKNRIMGIAKQAEGDVKEQAGKLTENPSLEAAGKLVKAEVTVQKTYGKVRDALSRV